MDAAHRRRRQPAATVASTVEEQVGVEHVEVRGSEAEQRNAAEARNNMLHDVHLI